MVRPVTPLLTVDAVVFEGGCVLLVKRRNEPFKGKWALPGGFVDVGETVEGACVREVLEETCLFVRVKRLVGVYSAPGRDPRGHTVSVVFLCDVCGGRLSSADDAVDVRFFSLSKLPPLAFDHNKIVEDTIT